MAAVSISLVPVFLAGLLDGINPCVFSTLLFLISSLTLAGRKRKEILIIGVFFTIAVFVTYYLVGLGLFQGLRSAYFFLLIYNISFIIPLFIVFILIYKGTGSKAITAFFRKNMGPMKISLSLLFLLLAGITLLI